MGVAGVAVAPPELTPDVGIERPEVHPGLPGGVEDRSRAERHELRAAQPLVEDRQGVRHPQLDQPHWRHTRHPDWWSTWAPQSGQGRDAGSPKGLPDGRPKGLPDGRGVREASGTGKIGCMVGDSVVTRIYPEVRSRQGSLPVTIM